MAFDFNPRSKVSGYSQGLIGQSIIIGLPSNASLIPSFVIGTTTDETANTSNSLPGMPITDGDLVQKSARNGGSYAFKLVLSETPNVTKEQYNKVLKSVQQISNLARTLLNPAPSYVPNLSGITTGYFASQLTTLQNMKDYFQPILALNLFMPLSSFSIRSNFLNSFWYIERLNFPRIGGDRGVVVDVSLKEVVERRSFSSPKQILMNLATEIFN